MLNYVLVTIFYICYVLLAGYALFYIFLSVMGIYFKLFPERKKVIISEKEHYDKVEILLPSYNEGRYIIDCIESLIGQIHKNLIIHVLIEDEKDTSYPFLKEKYERESRVILHLCQAKEKSKKINY